MIRYDVIVQLEELAEWFENPKVSPLLFVKVGEQHYVPSTLLRQISQTLEAEGWNYGTLCDLRSAAASKFGQHDNTLPNVGGIGGIPDLPNNTEPSRGASGGK